MVPEKRGRVILIIVISSLELQRNVETTHLLGAVDGVRSGRQLLLEVGSVWQTLDAREQSPLEEGLVRLVCAGRVVRAHRSVACRSLAVGDWLPIGVPVPGYLQNEGITTFDLWINSSECRSAGVSYSSLMHQFTARQTEKRRWRSSLPLQIKIGEGKTWVMLE
jgi:hypothetical protein